MELTCVTASGHNLEIMGEVRATLRINKFSWPWRFLVGKKLKGQPILGVDFISRSNLVLELEKFSCYFRFAAGVQIPFCKSTEILSLLYNICLDNKLPPVQCGKRSPRQKKELELIVQQYPDVLTSRLGLTSVLQYDIQLLDQTPVRLAPYRFSPPKMLFLREHLKKLLADGVIETSNSQYSSPMFLVPKGENNYRAVVDFRALNKKIAIESVPLLDIHSACHWFGKARYFTTIDLNEAYYQIPLSEASKPLTAFCTDWNLYQYARVPLD